MDSDAKTTSNDNQLQLIKLIGVESEEIMRSWVKWKTEKSKGPRIVRNIVSWIAMWNVFLNVCLHVLHACFFGIHFLDSFWICLLSIYGIQIIQLPFFSSKIEDATDLSTPKGIYIRTGLLQWDGAGALRCGHPHCLSAKHGKSVILVPIQISTCLPKMQTICRCIYTYTHRHDYKIILSY